MDTSSSRNRSNGHTFSNHFQRSLSPSARFCSSSSTFSTFSTRPGPLFSPSTSPLPSPSPSPSIRFSSISPGRSISVASRHQNPASLSSNRQQKKSCACSPTTHPGSFRCGLHKNQSRLNQQQQQNQNRSSHNNQLNMRRSAMTNSLVRIGTVEGELVKRALAALIRPSSHHLRRRGGFHPKPSRLSIMTKAKVS